MTVKHLLLFVAIVGLVGCSKEDSATGTSDASSETADASMTEIQNVSGADASVYLETFPGMVILDIRTPEEYAAGHIANAKNIDFRSPGFQDAIANLDKEQAYLVHCQSGGRSGQSLEMFERLGFKSIFHLDDGFSGWQKAGNPVEK